MGRGWNQFNFEQLLEWLAEPDSVAANKATSGIVWL
jgi:hypothetical protein